MIHSIYVVNEAGETLTAINLGKFKMDDALFGGFLSSIQMYSQKVSGKEVNELSLEDYRMMISKAGRVFLVTIHDENDKDAITANSRVAEVLDGLVNDIITDDTVVLLKKAAKDSAGGRNRANDWASKML
ncbi:MAG: hypothetical protein KAQ65_06070 [Candidatus Thorarchaeota archaeon]|nr:hypothetical protein [Candidatus Thorarchaeota archaeon]